MYTSLVLNGSVLYGRRRCVGSDRRPKRQSIWSCDQGKECAGWHFKYGCQNSLILTRMLSEGKSRWQKKTWHPSACSKWRFLVILRTIKQSSSLTSNLSIDKPTWALHQQTSEQFFPSVVFSFVRSHYLPVRKSHPLVLLLPGRFRHGYTMIDIHYLLISVLKEAKLLRCRFYRIWSGEME